MLDGIAGSSNCLRFDKPSPTGYSFNLLFALGSGTLALGHRPARPFTSGWLGTRFSCSVFSLQDRQRPPIHVGDTPLIFVSVLIMGVGSVRGTWLRLRASCQDVGPQYHWKVNNKSALYPVGNSLSKRKQLYYVKRELRQQCLDRKLTMRISFCSFRPICPRPLLRLRNLSPLLQKNSNGSKEERSRKNTRSSGSVRRPRRPSVSSTPTPTILPLTRAKPPVPLRTHMSHQSVNGCSKLMPVLMPILRAKAQGMRTTQKTTRMSPVSRCPSKRPFATRSTLCPSSLRSEAVPSVHESFRKTLLWLPRT